MIMLTTLLKTAAICFHMLATIVLVGHYLLQVLTTLPVLKKSFDSRTLLKVLDELNSQIQPRIVASLGVFFITGIYLMLVNPSYHGVGNFSNLWSVLMLVKHLIVAGMIVLGILLNKTMKAGMANTGIVETALIKVERFLYAMSAGGILVILLTAIVQAQ
jgi:hypothetical protein